MDSSVDLDLPDDIRVDQLAEWCYLAETFINSMSSTSIPSTFSFENSDSQTGRVHLMPYRETIALAVLGITGTLPLAII